MQIYKNISYFCDYKLFKLEKTVYTIKLAQFEGPFDLLLFFIERDELDIYNIPITKIIHDFLSFIHQQEKLNIELSSEFILFIATLMRIKAKMLIPRKELDQEGNEIDPRQELVDRILEYKKFKAAAIELANLANERLQYIKRGNIQEELTMIGNLSSEGTEINHISLFKLVKTFERILNRLQNKKVHHTVIQYNYTAEESKTYILNLVNNEKSVSFEKFFTFCENRMHAIFLFLSILELTQENVLKLLISEGTNNFIIEKKMGEEVE